MKTIASNTYIINKALINPYKTPPTLLNCFNIGNSATKFATAVTIFKIILSIRYNMIITAILIIFIDFVQDYYLYYHLCY